MAIDRAGTCLLRERISAVGGLLAVGNNLRVHFPWSALADRRADSVGTVASAAGLRHYTLHTEIGR